jgi:hypothetical protein
MAGARGQPHFMIRKPFSLIAARESRDGDEAEDGDKAGHDLRIEALVR